MPWWTTLLLLQTTKATLGITPSTRTDALEDACDTIEHKCGHESRWGFEVCRWRLKSDGERAEKARKGRDMTDEDMVASFENHMRLYQQRRDLSAKEKANAVNLKSDYCAWCFKNKGVKWNNHTESTCRNKKRAEGGDHGNVPGSGRWRRCQEWTWPWVPCLRIQRPLRQGLPPRCKSTRTSSLRQRECHNH